MCYDVHDVFDVEYSSFFSLCMLCLFRHAVLVCSAVFCISCSFVMCVVDAIADHILEAYSSICFVCFE